MDRILLVDDEEEFTRALSERLSARGVNVETAESGPTAIERVASRSYDLVILDMMMPVMDGLETLRKLREKDPDIQVILLTGHATVPSGVKALKQGALDYLEKPADIEELMAKIREAGARKMILVERKQREKIDEILRERPW